MDLWTATPHLAVGATHAEGVVWDAARERLLFVDIPHGLVYDHDPRTGAVEHIDVGRPVGAVAPRAAGGFVAAVREGFAVVEGGLVEIIATPLADDPSVRMNDGACDPGGRFLAGSMGFDARDGAGTLFSLGVDHSVHVLLEGVTISNGIDWNDDGTRCFYVDTPTQRIDVFDYDVDAGALHDRRPLAHVDRDAGMPDGMTVDADGNLWVALYGGGAVHRYDVEGQVTGRVELPGVTLVTSCCFGGPELRDLYISTSTEDLSAQERAKQPHAGSIFVAQPDAVGRPAPRFGG